jgi:multidrug resistance efflux pump
MKLPGAGTTIERQNRLKLATIVRLGQSAARQEGLAGNSSAEDRDAVTTGAHYKRLRPIRAESHQRQVTARSITADIHQQAKMLRGNLAIVHSKLDGLIVRAPVSGKVTAIDLKVGEIRVAGGRLASLGNSMKLAADIDEFLSQVRVGQRQQSL